MESSEDWLRYIDLNDVDQFLTLDSAHGLALDAPDEHSMSFFTEQGIINSHDAASDDLKRLLEDTRAQMGILEQRVSAKDAQLELLSSKVESILQRLDRLAEDWRSSIEKLRDGMQKFSKGLVRSFFSADEEMLDNTEP